MLLNEVGLQMYSLRDEAKLDFEKTFADAARMGYRGVELAGYGGLKPAELKKLLSDNGLACWGSHIGLLPKTDAELDGEIEMNLALGNRYLVCPYAEMKTREDALRLAEVMGATSEKLKAAGLRLGYHNHAHEFQRDGGEALLDILLQNTPDDVFAEIDVFWVAYAGVDPVEYIAKYPNRQPLIHLKELGADGRTNVEIGAGTLDFAAIIRKGQAIGVEHFIVEQEEYSVPPLASCKASLEGLKRL